ncbi:acetyl-CoA synthetase-like protein [Hypoxylon trugodes]|uniref:acetyl-CoA synthetase-like protein n=1 Tax=Hypoxylon trugodes TaxID=326681 RepID=UPI0021938DEA|nr:acetyl-CoA synthetase-like protein [Hypoxylon trugodes]KAI1385043.1 acetyl-CoA synthetase-like protein [Hypoxylon trugodes]
MGVLNSFHTPLQIPNVDLWQLVFERKDRQFPEDKEIYTDPDTKRSYTLAQAKTTALEFGKGLKSQWGFKRGDALGFFSPNSIDYAPVFFGVLWAGGACSTANPTYTAKELAFQMKDSKVSGIVTQIPMLPTVLEAAKSIGLPEDRIILLGDAKDPTGKFKHFTEIRASSILGIPKLRPRLDPKKDTSFLVYSSGTTGLPKGVQLTHHNIVANLIQIAHVESLNGLYHSGGPDGNGDKQIAVLPFFHVYGLTCIALQSAFMGIQAVMLPKFELEKFCKVIQDYGVTYASIPPPVVLALAKHPAVGKYDLSSVKWLGSGAAPLGRELVEQVWDRLTIPVVQGYGLSETSPAVTKTNIVDWKRFNGSCGKLLPNVEAKIVDVDTGAERGLGEGEGELWFRGPNIFPGYLNRPELQDSTFSKDGFFKTGDIGYADAKGNFYITDRLKELIKYKGFQVAPAELEAILLGHNEITDACVVPAHDRERETEVPRAYVVLRPDVPRNDEKAAEIIKFIEDRVAQHKRLRGGVRFVDEVPKNASGKLLRRVLKEAAKKEDQRAEGPKL